MRKLLMLLLIGILSFGLFTACGDTDSTDSYNSGGDPSSENHYEGYENADPITGGGDYEFDN